MIDPKDEVFRDIDDQAEGDNNRTHDNAGFLGDTEQDTEGDATADAPEEGHEAPRAMTIEEEGEKPWRFMSGTTNLTEEQLERVDTPSSTTVAVGADEETPEMEGTGYHEDPNQLKVGGEEA